MKEHLARAMHSMIRLTDAELHHFLDRCFIQQFGPKAFLSHQGTVSEAIFFLTRGLTRSVITDCEGNEHTIHFSVAGEFIADYTSFMLRTPANNSIQALEPTTAVVMPRTAVEWGYANLEQGDKMGRLIAEYYFVYFDNRLKNQYLYTPAQRYENLGRMFPDIHNRVPQHMIASFLGITPVHLSRLRKERR